MYGSQLTATSIIDILCLETIVEGNAAEVVQHIILNLADALAHELAHYILHKEKNTEFQDSTFFRGNNMDSLEYMANDFAAALLMPDDKVNELIKNGIRNIGKLAEKFDVSAAAMKYKVEKLGYKVK